jgi:hypothetical protein
MKRSLYKYGDVEWLYPVGSVVRFRGNSCWVVIATKYDETKDITTIRMEKK